MTWIMTANTNICRIYDYQKKKLILIEEIEHPENKLKASEVGSDKPGRYQSSAPVRGVYDPHTEIDEIQLNNFAKEMATKLNEARNKNEYEELKIIMPSQVEGEFSKHLNKNVKKMIKAIVHKNIMHLSERELLELLNDQTI